MYINVRPKFEKEPGRDRIAFSHECIERYWSYKKNGMLETERRCEYVSLRTHEFVSLCHCLAKGCNDIFGTSFPYSQEVIDRLKFFKPATVFGKCHNVGFLIQDLGHGRYEFIHRYWYEGFRKDRTGIDGISEATYGEYDREGVIAIAEAAQGLLKNPVIKTEAERILAEN